MQIMDALSNINLLTVFEMFLTGCLLYWGMGILPDMISKDRTAVQFFLRGAALIGGLWLLSRMNIAQRTTIAIPVILFGVVPTVFRLIALKFKISRLARWAIIFGIIAVILFTNLGTRPTPSRIISFGAGSMPQLFAHVQTLVSTILEAAQSQPILFGRNIQTITASQSVGGSGSSGSCQVTAEIGVNVRSGPGTNFEDIGGYDKGTPVTPLGFNDSGDWIQIQGGWIYRPGTNC